jgi:F0F1-type ATP synthase membrane subunit b/b'
MSTVISVRIKKEIKEELERQGIDINQEVRKFLEDLYLRVKAKEYVSKWIEDLNDVRPSEEGFSVNSVREDRESH